LTIALPQALFEGASRRGCRTPSARQLTHSAASNYPLGEISMRSLCLFLVACVAISSTARPAAAILQFYKVWETEYLTDHPDQDYVALVKKTSNRCFVCHEGKNRKHRNAYGAHLAELLDAKKDKKDTDKILAAIKEVGELHVDPNDDKSETFNDRIAASKFPGGELEDLKKEPPK
jgi:hypothetical protein